jgi:hypothetical protein
MTENESIIEMITLQVKTLLENHWADINDFRNGGEAIKIGFLHKLAYEGDERVCDTTINFAKRIRDHTVNRIDIQQMNFDLTGKTKAKRQRKPIGLEPEPAPDSEEEKS